MTERTSQINTLLDGTIIYGAFPDAGLQATINNSEPKVSNKANFQAVVDLHNVNQNYAEELDLVGQYFAGLGLTTDPLRVVNRDTLQHAYRASNTPAHTQEADEGGRHINDRSVIVENKEFNDLFGTDYTFGIMLHEAAHATVSGEEQFVRRVTEAENRRVILGGAVMNLGSWSKMDFRKGAEANTGGVFFEEAFADLTRVRALRSMGKMHDLQGSTSVFMVGEQHISVVPNGENKEFDPEVLYVPAEFALGAKSIGDKNYAATSAPNFAAYTLELLDQRAPGLYEDFLAARQDPKAQASAIQKIETVRPGLYKDLRDLRYTRTDFSNGLRLVVDIAREIDQSIK